MPIRFSNGVSDIRFLILVLTVLTVFYLIWQISLSGAILSAKTVEESRRLSDLARLTVGIGTALFIFRVGCQRLRMPLLIPLACLFGFGAMKAEDAIVNHLADRTSAQERIEAKTVLLFNTALNKNLVTLPDMARDIASDPVKVKAFSKVLGLAIWNDAALIAQISEKTSAVLNALYGQEMLDEIDAGYDRYVEGYQRNAEKLRSLQDALTHINFAAAARDLNGQLALYANCGNDACRGEIADRITAHVGKMLPNFPLVIEPEAFCKAVSQSTRYVMGRAVGGTSERVCAASEQTLYDYVMQRVEHEKSAALQGVDVPDSIKPKLLSESMLNLAEWRELWKDRIAVELEKKKALEFGNPEQYGHGGKLAEQGKDYAISVFLPPVALGFSVTVCFLHLASLSATLLRRPKISASAACVVYFSPYFFASGVPLSGVAGLYAKWLVFWQSFLFPFGILKNLIL